MAEEDLLSHSNPHPCGRCGQPCYCDRDDECTFCGCDVMAALKKGLESLPEVEIVLWPWPDDEHAGEHPSPCDLRDGANFDGPSERLSLSHFTEDIGGEITLYFCNRCRFIQDHPGTCEQCGYVNKPDSDVDKGGG